MTEKQMLLRKLPAVDRILREPVLQDLAGSLPGEILSEHVQSAVALLRQRILQGNCVESDDLTPKSIAAQAAQGCRLFLRSSLRKVINATGTLLHTNLGRAPLPRKALQAIQTVAEGYSNLEFDLDSGERGQRYSHVERLLTQLTGAEAALVVNNNSGAVLLALTALGKGREAIVSRGELVEIGGAFRIPDVMAAGGVQLREVGTSNRTHLLDYEHAIGENTAILLKVHTSNYRIVGFTKSVPGYELAPVAKKHELVLMEDLGSGLLLDLSRYGLEREPTVPEVVKAGVDVITFSGDKLLGGPQAGIIVGRTDLIDRMKKHPLARALRIDKLTLAALEATLQLYLTPQQAFEDIPVLKMFAADSIEQKQRCDVLCQKLAACHVSAEVNLAEDISRVGGGAMPLTELSDWAVTIKPLKVSVATLSQRLRQYTPAVVARVQNDHLLVNLRAVFPSEDERLTQIIVSALQEG